MSIATTAAGAAVSSVTSAAEATLTAAAADAFFCCCCCLVCCVSQANRAHTYLGKRESEWHVTGDEADIYPDFVTMAKSFGVPGQRVISKVSGSLLL